MKLKGAFDEYAGTLAFVAGLIILVLILIFIANQALNPARDVGSSSGVQNILQTIIGGGK